VSAAKTVTTFRVHWKTPHGLLLRKECDPFLGRGTSSSFWSRISCSKQDMDDLPEFLPHKGSACVDQGIHSYMGKNQCLNRSSEKLKIRSISPMSFSVTGPGASRVRSSNRVTGRILIPV